MTLLKKEQTENWEEAFDIVKNAFGEYRASWDAVWDESGSTLEYAFDFMEAAFYNSQEMVIFVSGINTDYSCVRFLKRMNVNAISATTGICCLKMRARKSEEG